MSAATEYGTADPQGAPAAAFEARAAFLLRLRERGIRDLAVLRAMEAIPRTAFLAERYAAFAFRDIALPGEQGQSVPEPLLVARIVGGGRLTPDHRVLLVGLGAGYTTAVLSQLVRHVVAIDRLPSLVAAAGARFVALGLDNIDVRCGDGLDPPPPGDMFDRIVLFGALEAPPPELWAGVTQDGAILHARGNPAGLGERAQVLVRVERQADGIGRQVILGPSRLTPLRRGVVRSSAGSPTDPDSPA